MTENTDATECFGRGVEAMERGEPGIAAGAFAQASQLFEERGDVEEAAIALMNLGAATLDLGDLDAARRILVDATARLRSYDLPGHEAEGLANLAVAEEEVGRLDAARAAGERAVSLFEEASMPQQLGLSRLNLAGLLERQGLTREALTQYQRSLPLFLEWGLDAPAQDAQEAIVRLGGPAR